MKQLLSHYADKLWKSLKQTPKHFGVFWRKNLWHKGVVIMCGLLVLGFGFLYGVGQWYIRSNQHTPIQLGTTFIPAYAESLGLEPQQTMDALLNDLHVKHFRLVSYWNQTEPQQGTYDFSQLDWQFKKAEEHGAKISLSIGLRQPRWPECHAPAWTTGMPRSQWQPALESYMTAVIERYKNSPALESYQLENEYFLKSFGTCTDFSRDRLIEEFALVKRLDPHTPVILSRSNNFPTVALGDPKPDLYGMSVYKRVWSPPIGRYFEYPLPGWYYGALAGMQKLFTGRDSVIHELQAEAWPPNRQGITDTSLAEQNKSIDAQRFADRIELARSTGMKHIELWGSEYWYYRMVHLHDDSLWKEAKKAFDAYN
jgi:hypothetical protein